MNAAIDGIREDASDNSSKKASSLLSFFLLLSKLTFGLCGELLYGLGDEGSQHFKRLSMDLPYKLLKMIRLSKSGYPRPFSHLDTDCLETCRTVATSF